VKDRRPGVQLARVLRASGFPTRTIAYSDGSRLVLLARGGRVVGLFGPRGKNFFWTHPDIRLAKAARRHFQKASWPNPGGGRVWLAPELDLFFPDYPDLRRYCHPPAVDPGRYRFRKIAGSWGMVTLGRVRIGRSGRELRFRLRQSFRQAENPVGSVPGVTYAGFVQKSSLEILDPARRVRDRLGLWHLVQVPHAGELRLPVRGCARPAILFCVPRRLSPKTFHVAQGQLRHRSVPRREYKIGLLPSQVRGRMAYLFPAGPTWNLLVREFPLDPRKLYVDVPWQQPRSRGAAVQFCGVDSPILGKFAEMEHHGPAVGRGTGRRKTGEISTTWAYRGSRQAVHRIARQLLEAQS
jgi:hypothetical protein